MNHTSSLVIDILIQDGEFACSECDISNPFWFLISVTGLQKQFSTPQVLFNTKTVWDYPTRLIIHDSDIMKSYLYFTLCTYDKKSGNVCAIARSRVGLRSFPFGKPKKIKIPLMSSSNSSAFDSPKFIGEFFS